ncbi:MAG: hypothetical protein M3548_00605 [Actinomycetota bacterium]|nr:hypothetical protein [Actinomycetota bacterium]
MADPGYDRLEIMSGMRVLDVDERGRLLVAVTDGDHGQLAEIDAKGTRRELCAAPGLTTARYLPGERKIVVQHGSPAQLALLRVGGELTPVVGSPDHASELLGVLPGRIVYRANRRHRLLFTVLIRNVLVGEEQAVYDRGGSVIDAAVSRNSRHIAVRLPRKLVLVDTMPVTEDDHVRLITAEPTDLGHRAPHWLPDSNRFVATDYRADSAQFTRYDVLSQEWEPLITDLSPTAKTATAPDGRRTAVVDQGEISFHQTENGRFLRSITAPADGLLWSPNSDTLVVTTEDEAVIIAADSATVTGKIPL